jgi:CRISPR-associated protein Cmr6
MLLGGFGKSWRRVDHRLFMPKYQKHLIGCHWQWTGESLANNPVNNLEDIAPLINNLREVAKSWLTLQGKEIRETNNKFWRETWHPENVTVWGRKVSNGQSSAIHWLHSTEKPPQKKDRFNPHPIPKQKPERRQEINYSRVWHRMYPLSNGEYLELVTIFKDKNDERSNNGSISVFKKKL